MARHVEIDIDSDANTGGFVATAAAADRAANKVDELGDQMRGTSRDAAALDVAILRTKTRIYELGQEYIKTGKEDAFKNLRNQRGILASLQQISQETDKISLGSLFHGATVDAVKLTERIRETKIAVDELGAAFVKTGDKDILKSLREQRGTLQVLEQIAKGLDDTADTADAAAAKTARLGDNLRSTAQSAHTLTERIEASRRAVLALGQEFVKTGDRDVFRNLREERGVLRNLEQMHKEMDLFGQAARRVGGDLGDLGNFSGVISAGFKALPPEVKLALLAGVAAALPAIGAAISGALLAGLSGVTLGAGIMAAAQSAAVQNAWKTFGQGALNSLSDAASVLEGPLVKAASTFTQAINVDSLREDFEAVAPLVSKLADGIVGMFQEFQPGFLEGLKGAQPVFEALADSLPQLGHDLGEFFRILGEQGTGAGQALELTLSLLGQGLIVLANLLAMCSAAFELFGGSTLLALDRLDLLGILITSVTSSPILPWLANLINGSDETSSSFHKLTDAERESAQMQTIFEQALATGKQAMQEARKAAEDLEHQISSLATTVLNGRNADLAAKSGRLDMIEALKASKGSLDETTKSGIAAEQSMVRQAQNAVAVRDSMLAQKLGVEAADRAFNGLIDQLYRDADANGVARESVDRVIGSLRSLPRPNPIDIELHRMGYTDDDLREYKRSLLGAQGTYTANVVTNHIARYTIEDYREAGRANFNAKGGIVHAATGVIAKPGIYRGHGAGMVVAAEGVTGHEGFVPQRGISRQRAAGLLGEMAGWHGMGVYDQRASGYAAPVMAGGGATSASTSVRVVELRAAAGDLVAEALLSLLRPTVRGRYGGDVTAAVGGAG